MIFSFLNQKGGVGKTTLSCNFASALALAGCRVLLVDADPQHGAISWVEHREVTPLFPVIGLPSDKLHREIPAHTENYDHIIIDAPPQVSSIAKSIIIASDVVLIPVQPSPHDIWAAATIVDIVGEAIDTLKPSLKAAFIVNRKIAGTVIGRDIFEALEQYRFAFLPTAICQRVAFAESAAEGKGVMEMTGPDARGAREATAEITQLAKEIMEFIRNGEENEPRERHEAPAA